MNTQRAAEEKILKSLTGPDKKAQRQKWAEQERKIRDAFSASPRPDVDTLRDARNWALRPTFRPTLERMLEHRACQE